MDNSSPAWQDQSPSFLALYAVFYTLHGPVLCCLRNILFSFTNYAHLLFCYPPGSPITLIGSLISQLGSLSFDLTKPPTPAPQPPDFAGLRRLYAPPVC
ncbi:hypothetical protein GGI43DRAFT_328125 [Trichoderma evansii]